MECVALHTHRNYIYFINYTTNLMYPSQPGLPVKALDNVSWSEHDGIQSACISGPFGVFDVPFIPSWPAILTVHSEWEERVYCVCGMHLFVYTCTCTECIV